MEKRQLTKLLLLVFVALHTISYLASANSWHFVDSVDLLIHEAGHVIFSPFGAFMTILGGSLLQVLLPLVFVVYFWIKNQKYSAGILLNWVAVNLINVSVYAGDAVRMQLPLISGDTDGHDWNNLMLMTVGLKYTEQVSGIIWGLGVIAAIVGIYISYKYYKDFNNQ